jgi:hypothetical protein
MRLDAVLARALGLSSVGWLEKVSEEQYLAGMNAESR